MQPTVHQRIPADLGVCDYLVVPDRAVLLVRIVLVQGNPVIDESHCARPRVREYQRRALVQLRVLCGRGVIVSHLAVVVWEADVCLCVSDEFQLREENLQAATPTYLCVLID